MGYTAETEERMSRLHIERHKIGRVGWLRAAVLGANDGIVSTSSLVVGVAAAAAGKPEILLAGFAGLAAGALSMAAGEYVSVSSQADTEAADLARERRELDEQPEFELDELTAVYVGRGLEPKLAREVATQLTAKDALAAHARDELALSDLTTARPLQAAMASAATFSVGCGPSDGRRRAGAAGGAGARRGGRLARPSSPCSARSALAPGARRWSRASAASCSGARWRWP